MLISSSDPGVLQWDFCAGDFANVPTAQTSYSVPGAIGRPSMEFAHDGSKWFALLTGTWSNSLYRLEFQNGIANLPTTIENLGDLNGKLNGPGSIRIINHKNDWFAIVHNTNSGELLKLSFGPLLSNPISEVTALTTNIGSVNNGFALAHDAVDGWVCLISNNSNQFQLLRLGDELIPPQSSDILTTAAVVNPNNLGDVDLVQHCGQWYGFASNFGNGVVYKLSFGANAFQIPVIDQVADLGGINGGRLRVIKEDEDFFLAVTSLSGNFYKIDLGDDLSINNLNVVNEGNFGTLLQNSYGLAVAKEGSFWNISVVDLGSGKVTNVNYSAECPVNVIERDPNSVFINYSQPGNYKIALTNTNSNFSGTKAKFISVSNLVAPEIDFYSQNLCANHNVEFYSVSNSGDELDYQWDFGDASLPLSSDQNVIHQYDSPGNYTVTLNVDASNGCSNLVEKVATIYGEPVSLFTLPSGLICTNNEFTFINNTTDNFDSNLSYEWFVNNTLISNDRDLQYTFSSSGDQQIKLITSIPGCSNELVQILPNIGAGPIVGFDEVGNCENELIAFTNSSQGDIASYQWNFGNGDSSSAQNPTTSYLNAGAYSVSLQTTGINGCTSSVSKPLSIYSKPEVNFSLDLPPFSCSGAPSQFHDLTPVPDDSNLESWNWDFGEGGLGTGKNPSHIYALAGEYQVGLTVTTDQGCSAAIEKPVVIHETPQPDFSFDAACINKLVRFETTADQVKSWQWKINNSNYPVQNPTHVFLFPGTYTAQLTATGSTDCVGSITKTIIVPEVPALDFAVEGVCVNAPSKFVNVSDSESDPILATTWNFGPGDVGSGTSIERTFDEAGTYPVFLKVKNVSGCKYELVKNITIYAPPVATFTISNDTGPPPLEVEFTNQSTGAVTYRWFSNNIEQSNATNFSTTFTELGDYVVDLFAASAQGCVSSTTGTVKVIIPRTDLTLEQFNLIEDGSSGSILNQLVVTNNGNFTVKSFDVVLDLGNGTSVRERVTSSIAPNSSATMVLANALVGVSSGYVCLQLVIADDESSNDNERCVPLEDRAVLFNPSPNPAKDVVNLQVISPATTTGKVRLVSQVGVEVAAFELALVAGLNTFSVNLTVLQPGLYFIMVEVDDSHITQRLFVR